VCFTMTGNGFAASAELRLASDPGLVVPDARRVRASIATQALYLSIDELLSQQPPLSTAFTVANTAATPLSLANGFLVPATGAANTFAVDPN